jgi:hypothetical protein
MPNIGTESNISLIRFNEQGSTPSTPASGFSAIYMKADGLYIIDDAGAVTGPVFGGSSAPLLADGSVALAGAWDMGSQSLTNVNIDSGSVTNITDLLVADGGTGRSTHTAYAVICGGTLATTAQQSVSGVGTSGQVLTSNGAAALPTWQAGGGGSVAFHLPQGRLGLTTGDSNDESDVTGSTLYYTPHIGREISVLDVIGDVETLDFSETTLSLSGFTANTLYDIWGYSNSGTFALDSTSWGTNTAYNISTATAADPCVITYLHTSQIFAVGDDICIQGITGSINGVLHCVTTVTAIAVVSAGVSYSVTVEIDTTGLTYTSGGTVRLLKSTRATAINTSAYDIPIKTGDITRRYLGTILVGGDGGETHMRTERQFVANYYNRVERQIKCVFDIVGNWVQASSTSNWQLAAVADTCKDGVGRFAYVAPFGGCRINATYASGGSMSAAQALAFGLDQNIISRTSGAPDSDSAFGSETTTSAMFAKLYATSENEGYNYVQKIFLITSGFTATVWTGKTGLYQFDTRGYVKI